MEQPQSDESAGETDSGLEGLRKAVYDGIRRLWISPTGIAFDAYIAVMDVVNGHFSRSTLVAFERRDFELVDKHNLRPVRMATDRLEYKIVGSVDCRCSHPDYLTALRAAIAEARRREGEVQDEC